MSILYAKLQLTEWGRWSRDPPALRSNWRTWFSGTGRAHNDFMPAHIRLVDQIVCRMEKEQRVVVIIHYCQTGSGREKARRLEMDKDRYFRLLDQGQWFVAIELDNSPPCDFATVNVYNEYRDKAVTKAR